MNSKMAFIIPGYTYSPNRREYKKIAKFFEQQGIRAQDIEIHWKLPLPRDFNEYTKEFLTKAKKYKADEIYVLGFSFGAVIALLSAAKLKPKAIVLCSLSPYFQEDWPNLKKSWLRWWHKNYKNTFVFQSIVRNSKTKVHLLVGSKEDKSCIIRAKDAHKALRNSSLKVVKNAEHKLQQAPYLQAVRHVIETL